MLRAGESVDVSDLRIDRIAEHPSNAGDGRESFADFILLQLMAQIGRYSGDLAACVIEIL